MIKVFVVWSNAGFSRSGRLLPRSAARYCSVFISQSFICFFADLMKRPKALSFFRLSTYDISWYSDSFLSFI